MCKVKISMFTGYPSMDSYDIISVTDEDLDELAWDMALAHAESHGLYPYPDDLEDGEDESCYSQAIEGSWEYVV